MLTAIDLVLLRDQLTVHEGRRGDVYDDATGTRITQGSVVRGHPTIGIGANLDAAPLCDAAIDAEFDHRVAGVLGGIEAALPWAAGLDGPRLRVLVDIAFNAGVDGLLGFRRMLAALKRGDYQTAAAEIVNSRLAPARARRLAALMTSPTDARNA